MAVTTGEERPAAAPPLASASPAGLSEAQIRYALILLLIIFTLNFLDRQIVTILAEPISQELNLNDAQIGLMTGLAFALFYTVLGIPIARWADNPSSNRVGIIAGAVTLWSGMTALCGFATSYWQMLLARVGVGIGEAGCTPPAHSLIADYVAPERRARAIAFYGIGIPLGMLLGLVIGGLVADAYGWRTAFFVAAAPGVLIGVITWFTLKEPRRFGAIQAAAKAAPAAPAMPLGEAIKQLAKSKAYVNIVLAATVAAWVGYGLGVWTIIYFIRVHDMTPGEVGVWLGVTSGIGGIVGTWLGGQLADKYAKVKPGHAMLAPAIGMAIASPLFLIGWSQQSWILALILIWVPGVLNSMWYGPMFASIQNIVAPQTRAMAAAICLFALNLVGLGLGPTMLGVISHALTPELGRAEAVRVTIMIASVIGVFAAFFMWRAAQHMNKELAR
jgi:MFS transporter, Spinster family, sphingosine-1-phosphate transporter